jgi:hypothetical protein
VGRAGCYIDIILDGRTEQRERFFRSLGQAAADVPMRRRELYQLLEMQRHLLLMYTSCGWFFDDISGTSRCKTCSMRRGRFSWRRPLKVDLEPPFLDLLATAESNVVEVGNGRALYERQVRPRKVDLAKAFAHYAITSLFQRYEEPIRASTATTCWPREQSACCGPGGSAWRLGARMCRRR